MATLILSLTEASQSPDRRLVLQETEFFQDREVLKDSESFSISAGRFEERPKIFDSGGAIICCYGEPRTVSGSPMGEAQLHALFAAGDPRWESLDSSFLVLQVSEDRRRAKVVTDRFNSRPAFFFQSTKFLVVSTEFRSCSAFAVSQSESEIDPSAILEFLWFRRLFGDVTYNTHVQLAAAASEHTFTPSGKVSRGYWRYQHEPDRQNVINQNLNKVLADSIRSGIETELSRPKNHGLLLSGGLDSRLMLAVGGQRYQCITNAPENNNEVQVARRLAAEVNSPHVFLPRPVDYLGTVFDGALESSNGMTVYYECQFLGYHEILRSMVDNVQMGLFYDIFFCGHYMPKAQPSFFGRNALFFRKMPIDYDNFLDNFFRKISYRQKQTQLDSVFEIDVVEALMPKVFERLQSVYEEGFSTGLRAEGLWEYMHLSNLGRHYSMLMAKSLRPFIDVRLPALTNENYSLALAMPPEAKRNWGSYLAVLNSLANGTGLMNEINANTNIAARYGLYRQSLIKLTRGLRKQIGLWAGPVSPSYRDRSWPLVNQSILENPIIRETIEEVINDSKLIRLKLLKRSAVEDLFHATNKGKKDHSIFLNQLVTLEKGALDVV